jgi:hypothetical protein
MPDVSPPVGQQPRPQSSQREMGTPAPAHAAPRKQNVMLWVVGLIVLAGVVGLVVAWAQARLEEDRAQRIVTAITKELNGNVLELSYEEIAAQKETLTAEEWDEFVETLKWKRIDGWNGTILDVDTLVWSEEWYRVGIDLEAEGGPADFEEVFMEVPKAEAIQMSEGQGITFSGLITSMDCTPTHCPIKIEGVSYTLK